MGLTKTLMVMALMIGAVTAGGQFYEATAADAAYNGLVNGIDNVAKLGAALGQPGGLGLQHPTPLVSGDFDGNGTLDTARLAPAGNNAGWRIIVEFDVTEFGPVISLEHLTPDVPIKDVRLSIEAPTSYITACGQDPKDCTEGSPAAIVMETDGIFLQVQGAPSLVIYWDHGDKKFKTYRPII